MPRARPVEWVPVLLTLIGLAITLFGVRSYAQRGHFGLVDAVVCALLLVPAGLSLLVTSYVLQHARLVALIPVAAGAMLVIGHPPFAVALGLGLMGSMLVPAFEEWRDQRRAKG